MDRRTNSGDGWTRLGTVAPGELVEARIQLHHAVQLLSAFGQTYLDRRPDDSHRSMSWDPRARSFLSDPTPEGIRLALVVPELKAVLLGPEDEVSALPLGGRTLEGARNWLEDAVARAPGGSRVPLGRREYDLPPHPVESGETFGPDLRGLRELSNWFADAWVLLDALRAETPGASPIRCWPHHFDLATLITVVPAEGDHDARTVGVGLSPGDEGTSEPYFYVNLWPHPEPDALPAIEGPGRWNREGWTGAVLTASDVVEAGDGTAQAEVARRFVDQRVGAARSLLTGG